eukprot:12928290-Prorocentrum_lima.AAC.1
MIQECIPTIHRSLLPKVLGPKGKREGWKDQRYGKEGSNAPEQLDPQHEEDADQLDPVAGSAMQILILKGRQKLHRQSLQN